jgi:hypothetical protein
MVPRICTSWPEISARGWCWCYRKHVSLNLTRWQPMTPMILRQRPPRGLDNGSVTAGKHNDYLSLDDEINKTPKVRRWGYEWYAVYFYLVWGTYNIWYSYHHRIHQKLYLFIKFKYYTDKSGVSWNRKYLDFIGYYSTSYATCFRSQAESQSLN